MNCRSLIVKQVVFTSEHTILSKLWNTLSFIHSFIHRYLIDLPTASLLCVSRQIQKSLLFNSKRITMQKSSSSLRGRPSDSEQRSLQDLDATNITNMEENNNNNNNNNNNTHFTNDDTMEQALSSNSNSTDSTAETPLADTGPNNTNNNNTANATENITNNLNNLNNNTDSSMPNNNNNTTQEITIVLDDPKDEPDTTTTSSNQNTTTNQTDTALPEKLPEHIPQLIDSTANNPNTNDQQTVNEDDDFLEYKDDGQLSNFDDAIALDDVMFKDTLLQKGLEQSLGPDTPSLEDKASGQWNGVSPQDYRIPEDTAQAPTTFLLLLLLGGLVHVLHKRQCFREWRSTSSSSSSPRGRDGKQH